MVGATLGVAFGRRAIPPALIAAVTPPTVYLFSFLYLFEADGLVMVQTYWFEACVLLAVLPSAAYLVGKRHGA